MEFVYGKMKKLLLIALLVVGCEKTTEPQDCADVVGGTAGLDSCAVCVGGTTNLTACSQDCAGVWGGDGVDLDSDHICDNIDLCVGVFDECGACNGNDNNNDNRCEYTTCACMEGTTCEELEVLMGGATSESDYNYYKNCLINNCT
jgi:hypothetical protein